MEAGTAELIPGPSLKISEVWTFSCYPAVTLSTRRHMAHLWMLLMIKCGCPRTMPGIACAAQQRAQWRTVARYFWPKARDAYGGTCFRINAKHDKSPHERSEANGL